MMLLKDSVFLAADTIRSRAYSQAIDNRGMHVDAAIIIKSRTKKFGQSDEIKPDSTNYGGLYVPDLTIPLENSVTNIAEEIYIIESGSINSKEVYTLLNDKRYNLVIYSGFGGEIVTPEILDSGKYFLHIHAGWLPDYRGSTTIYYSYLCEKKCGASAICLKSTIDTGPIIRKKKYPPPPPFSNVDYYYDSIIRSDLLITVLEEYSKHSDFMELEYQDDSIGSNYYIIHPVLKHIALLNIHGMFDKVKNSDENNVSF